MSDKSNVPLDVTQLLLEHHLQYQAKQSRRVTAKEFAEYIGINEKLYSLIYNKKRKPSRDVVVLFATFFDDLRFYDAVGEPRPDPVLYYVQENWGRVPEQVKRAISEMVEKYSGDEHKKK